MGTIDHRQPLGVAHRSRTGERGKRVYRWDWSAGAWTDTGARRPPAAAPPAEAVGQSAWAQPLSTSRRPAVTASTSQAGPSTFTNVLTSLTGIWC